MFKYQAGVLPLEGSFGDSLGRSMSALPLVNSRNVKGAIFAIAAVFIHAYLCSLGAMKYSVYDRGKIITF